MKVRQRVFDRRALVARASIILSFSFVLLLSVFTAPAGAITRSQVLSRAMSWVKHRVPYSQHRYYHGYRRDCSGFVSMAWGLNTSYTSSTISAKALRIPLSKLKLGDAVLVRGRHVALFDRWVNKKRGLYVAIEQTTWGDHVRKHVRRIPRRAVGIRRRGMADAPKPQLVACIAPPSAEPHPVLVAVVNRASTTDATLTTAAVDGATSEATSTVVATSEAAPTTDAASETTSSALPMLTTSTLTLVSAAVPTVTGIPL